MPKYVIYVEENAGTRTHRIALFCNRNEIVYFDSFGVENIPEEIKEFIVNKNIIANIFRVQANNSVKCGYFYIEFVDFMLAGKKFTDYTNFFSPHNLKKKIQYNSELFSRYMKLVNESCQIKQSSDYMK